MTPSQYASDMMPKKVPWWRLIARYRRAKIVAFLWDIALCPACAVTIPSHYAVPCRIHQNDFEKDVVVAMIQFDRMRKDGYYVDQAKIDFLEKKLK